MSACVTRAKGANYWLKSKTVMQNILILSAILTLTACTTTTLSSSSHSSLINKSAAAPKAQTTTAVAEKAAPAIAAAPAQETAAAETVAAADSSLQSETTPSVQGSLTAEAAQLASLTGSEPMMNTAGAHLAALVAEEMDTTPGMINQNSCIKGLQGTLVTSLAGQSLLAENGLTDDTLAEGGVIAVASMVDLVDVSPAPSAGTAEAAATPSVAGSLNFKTGTTESLLMAAYGQTGRHYKAGGQAPNVGFDASGFTRWVYSQKGVNVPRDMAKQAQGGVPVAKEDLRPGDLLVYRDPNAGKSDGYHVGIYTGQGNFLHAAAKVGVVTETAAFGPQYAPYFVSGRRYYDDPKASPLSDTQKMSAASSAVKVALSELGPNDKPDRKVYKKPRPNKASAAKSKKKK